MIRISNVEKLTEFLGRAAASNSNIIKGVSAGNICGNSYAISINSNGSPTHVFSIYKIANLPKHDIHVPNFLKGTTKHWCGFGNRIIITNDGEVYIDGKNYSAESRERFTDFCIELKTISDYEYH